MKNGPISVGVAGPRSPFTLRSSPFTLRKYPSLFTLLLLLTLGFGCSSHNTDGGISMITGDADYSSSNEYDVKIVQAASPMSFPKADRGSIDVNFEITIKNLHQEPVTIDRISLQSIGGSVYRLDTSSRQYKKEIAAGATEIFKFWAPARVEGTTFDAKAPLVVRAVVDTIINGATQRETFNREVNGRVGVAVGRS
jgi:hypothetical protein